MGCFIKVLPKVVFAASICLAAFSYAADDLTDSLMLKMKYLSQSQAVISKNLANANTPGYKALEVKEPRYSKTTSLGLLTTSPSHIGGIGAHGQLKVIKQKDTYETAPNGNNVSVEEQMMKMSSNSTDHQAATNLMRKASGMVGLALGER